jgi:hypothetical protein
MTRRGILLTAVTLTVVLLGANAEPRRLVERWIDKELEKRTFERLLVIAITDDYEARRNFENKFVSHLRGWKIDGVTSHSLVKDLTSTDDEKVVLDAIEGQEIDGAITVRVVPLKGISEEQWAAQWKAATESDGSVRALVDESLPLEGRKAKHYGIEVAVWETANGDRIWAGRTNPYTVKQMRKGSGEFVQFVMQALKSVELLTQDHFVD